MLKSILLLMFATTLWAQEDHATISIQRWQKKLVVTIDHEKGWHTYWKNPGDAGIASSFKFSQNTKALDVKAYEWPVPHRYLEEGNIMTIGYSDRQHFFFDDIPGAFDAHVGVLICKDVCIPGEAKFSVAKDQNFVSNRKTDIFSDGELKSAFDLLPSETTLPTGFEFYLTRVKDQNALTLHYSIKGVKNPKLPHELGLLTGFPSPPFGYKRESLYVQEDTLYGKTEIEWDGEYQEPPVPLPPTGNFGTPYKLKFLINAPGIKDVKIVTLNVKDFTIATPSVDEFYKKLEPFNGKATAAIKGETKASMGIMLEYILFAFLGGLILNLMPCVLPVISLKLFGLIKHSEYTQKKIFQHNLSYTCGILTTFMALALVIVGLKIGGEEVGWGFQLQSPAFILVMILVLFILSLNLFGLFEFVTPGGNKLGGAKTEDGFMGDFFSGVLTTILSTPCSAPFLGTALTFAFTTNYASIFIIFFSIGLGLASPFLLTALFPKALAIFPRPGAWMEKLKYFLGFTLLATVIWLYDVFVSLVNFEKMSWRFNLLFVFWFFAFFFAKKISRLRFLQFLFFVIPVGLTVLAIQDLELRPTTVTEQKAESLWKPWSEEKLSEENGNLVFMDFTAEWCLTCKVNKKLVLETNSFEKLAKKHNLVLMRADWTKRDDNITQFLKKYHAVGVPAYFIQKPDGSIISLGETITLSKIEKNL